MERLKLRIAVYVILIKEDKILLSRRFNTGWQDGNYTLPSGHLEVNEMLIEALLRETNELPESMVPSVRFAIENYKKGILFSEFQSES